jgi:hypothetical protein
MSDKIQNRSVQDHLFTVDILIESTSNGLALEKLVHLLNSPEIKDYKIQRGIELGKIIEAALQKEAQSGPKAGKPANQPEAAPSASKTPADNETHALAEQIERFKANNTLVRLTIVKGKGVKLSVPCRILNYDAAAQLVTVYHVDEKKVYSFHLNEIDDLLG